MTQQQNPAVEVNNATLMRAIMLARAVHHSVKMDVEPWLPELKKDIEFLDWRQGMENRTAEAAAAALSYLNTFRAIAGTFVKIATGLDASRLTAEEVDHIASCKRATDKESEEHDKQALARLSAAGVAVVDGDERENPKQPAQEIPSRAAEEELFKAIAELHPQIWHLAHSRWNWRAVDNDKDAGIAETQSAEHDFLVAVEGIIPTLSEAIKQAQAYRDAREKPFA